MGSSPSGAAAAEIPLPEDPAVAVLELVFVDHPGTKQEKEVVAAQVLASGKVRPQGEPMDRKSDYRMTSKRLRQLVSEIVVTHGVGEIDSARLGTSIRKACEAAGLSPEIEGAAATVIRFRTADRAGEVRCEALSVMAARFPEMLDVQRLHDAQLRLQNVAAIARAGGEDASERLAEIANDALKAQRPDAPPLTHRDLSMVRELSTGSRYVQFYRRPTSGSGELLVSVFQIPGQPARVSVTAPPN
jgi:hypothetical protein